MENTFKKLLVMRFKNTPFKDLIIISHKKFVDYRGEFREVFRKNLLEKNLGYKLQFCQENIVKSDKYVLRGLHYQNSKFSQSKLISVLQGKIFDIAVDIRENSKTYGKYFSYFLSSSNNESIFIPKGFAHGYLSLQNQTIVKYKVDNYYNANSERGIMYNDQFLNIDWGVKNEELIISEKDKNYTAFKWK